MWTLDYPFKDLRTLTPVGMHEASPSIMLIVS